MVRSRRWSTVLLVGGLIAGLTSASGAEEPPHRRVALLDGGSSEPEQLYVVEPDGTSRPLGASSYSYGTSGPVRWADQTDEIVYIAPSGETRAVAADGSGDRLLADRRGVPSPDGQWVAYVEDGALWIVAVDRDDRRQLTSGEAPRMIEPYDVSWDASSYRLAVRAVQTHQEGAEVYVTDIEGSTPARLSPLDLHVGIPVWSPDNRWIAFSDNRRALFKVRPDGSELTELRSPDDEAFAPVAWAPDGSWLAFGGKDVSLVDADGGNERRVSEHASDMRTRIDVADDGGALVYDQTVHDSGGTTFHRAFLVDLVDLHVHDLDADGRSGSVTDQQFRPALAPGVTRRSAGATRVRTAVAVSRHVRSSATDVVLGRADLYPDALAGAPLAGAVDGPVLLTHHGGLADEVGDEIGRLGATTAWLLGDGAALSEQVERDLEARGVTDIRRLAGPTRFDTAAEVARELGGAHVYIVEGADHDPARGWPDATAVSALAAHLQRPVLLVTTDELPDATRQAIRALGTTRATIIGGLSAVSQSVEDQLADLGLDVDRLAGRTRYETSHRIATASVEAGLSAGSTWFTTGRNWPDSLAAGPAAASLGGVLLLVDGHGLDGSPPARSWLDAHAASIEHVRLVGGPDVLAPGVKLEIETRIPSP